MLFGSRLKPFLSLSFVALVLLSALAGAVLAQGTTKEVETRIGTFYSEGLDGVDLSGLTTEEKELALKVLNESSCNCGCGMTVAQCRVEDQSCPRSPTLARAIVDAVRRGEDEAAVRAVYQATASATGKKVRAPAVTPAAPVFNIPAGDSVVRGPADAPVTIVEFSDFQCPYCGRAVPVVEGILKEFDGQVRLVFKHLPLPFHAQARLAAAAAEAARNQGKFWEMHDLMFANNKALLLADLEGYARQLELDVARFSEDLNDPRIAERITQDVREAKRVGASGTPTFFVNGRRVPNYRAAGFRNAIRRELRRLKDTEAGGQ